MFVEFTSRNLFANRCCGEDIVMALLDAQARRPEVQDGSFFAGVLTVAEAFLAFESLGKPW